MNIEKEMEKIDKHNKKMEEKISKEHEQELIRITKEFIKACNKINNNYNSKEQI